MEEEVTFKLPNLNLDLENLDKYKSLIEEDLPAPRNIIGNFQLKNEVLKGKRRIKIVKTSKQPDEEDKTKFYRKIINGDELNSENNKKKLKGKLFLPRSLINFNEERDLLNKRKKEKKINDEKNGLNEKSYQFESIKKGLKTNKDETKVIEEQNNNRTDSFQLQIKNLIDKNRLPPRNIIDITQIEKQIQMRKRRKRIKEIQKQPSEEDALKLLRNTIYTNELNLENNKEYNLLNKEKKFFIPLKEVENKKKNEEKTTDKKKLLNNATNTLNTNIINNTDLSLFIKNARRKYFSQQKFFQLHQINPITRISNCKSFRARRNNKIKLETIFEKDSEQNETKDLEPEIYTYPQRKRKLQVRKISKIEETPKEHETLEPKNINFNRIIKYLKNKKQKYQINNEKN